MVGPAVSREHYTEFLHAEHKELKYGEDMLDEHDHEVLEEGPFLGNNFIITNTLLSCWAASAILVLIFVLGSTAGQAGPGATPELL